MSFLIRPSRRYPVQRIVTAMNTDSISPGAAKALTTALARKRADRDRQHRSSPTRSYSRLSLRGDGQ